MRHPQADDARRTTIPAWYALAGLVLVAINLRPALASVGPLVNHLRASTGLSSTALGLLTTLPLLAFGVVSNLTPVVTRRWGIERAIALALALTAMGSLLRAAEPVTLLFGGMLLAGIGIALGNVLLPALVKQDFPTRTGPTTSLYSSVMALGATVAAGVSVPLAAAVGWRQALAVWAIPALVALAGWLPRLTRPADRPHGADDAWTPGALLRSALAWQVALYLGLQSFTFYAVLAWLPDLVHLRGFSPAEAGGLLALSQATGIVGSAVVPTLAARRTDHRAMVWVLTGVEVVALVGLLVPDASSLTTLCVAVLGTVLGGTFGLALLFLVARASDVATATALSGFAQSVGYLVAAAGPTLTGFLRDVTRGWTIPVLFLLAVVAGKLLSGLGAGRPEAIRLPGTVAVPARSPRDSRPASPPGMI